LATLSRGERTLNARAAFLHVLGNLAATAATLVSGVLIYFFGWMFIDPLLSIVISVLIAISSYRLLRESLRVLMEGIPHHLNIDEVSKTITSLKEVKAVHDVHIWTVSSTAPALSAHVNVYDLRAWDNTLTELKSLLHEKYHIDHITLQLEADIEKCKPCLKQPAR
jgi:cobalt-zinc-cadmium efflux system protein